MVVYRCCNLKIGGEKIAKLMGNFQIQELDELS